MEILALMTRSVFAEKNKIVLLKCQSNLLVKISSKDWLFDTQVIPNLKCSKLGPVRGWEESKSIVQT